MALPSVLQYKIHVSYVKFFKIKSLYDPVISLYFKIKEIISQRNEAINYRDRYARLGNSYMENVCKF